jgi:hypothetical protein
VIRIWNNGVIENPDGVLQRLLSELALHPDPPGASEMRHPAGARRRAPRGASGEREIIRSSIYAAASG